MDIKKILALGVILLFIGVAVAPNINFNVVKASNDNDLVEVTTQACGIKGFGNQTVKLTRQQYQSLEEYLVDFRARLNQTTTREEAVPIFKEAVVELNTYGLLPKGMSVERAQRLVTSQYQNNNMEKLQKRLLQSHLSRLGNNSNLLCLIAGFTTWTGTIGLFPALIIGSSIIGIIFAIKYIRILLPIFQFIFILSLLSYFLPATIFSLMILGIYGAGGVNGHAAEGWVSTFGMNLIKSWSGSLVGDAFDILGLIPVGVVGFAGIKINNVTTCFYLGSALWVKINSY